MIDRPTHPDAGLWLFGLLACNLVRADDGSWRLPFADPAIDGPRTPCPWPFDPMQLVGQPIGQYHCPYCGSMVLAGIAHPDYDGGPGFGGDS